MTPAISLDELLAWSQESSRFWKEHFDANPVLLELPCSIDNSGTVLGLVRHIWVADLRWAQRIGGLPLQSREELPTGPLEALYGLHRQAAAIFKALLDHPEQDWETILTLDYDWLPPQARAASRRKLLLHALLHSQRHWAQMATLLRTAGYPSDFKGDMIFSAVLG